MVPSPEPVRIVELDITEQLPRTGAIVTCAGGGGIPVIRDDTGGLHGVEAVIDKDLIAALSAAALRADASLILTDVPTVISGYGTASAQPARRATVAELRALSFPAGSTGPKVEAARRFAGTAGTTVTP